MAYSRQKEAACPLAIDPGVLSVYLPWSSGETNIKVNIPWDNVNLVHAEALTLVAVDSGDLEIDLEILDTGSTSLGEAMTITVATSGSAVGTVTEATVTSNALCQNLSENYKVNVEIDGAASGTTGAQMLYLYFEPA